jgi:pimeloyl-ACP methyl ester carboxylesterase
MTEPIRRSVDAGGVCLNVYVLPGPEDQPQAVPLLMLHGMRDVALSLMPVATVLAGDRPVYLLDLRGHGASDRPGHYAMHQFVFDAQCVLESLIGRPAALFGHSLGGHIVTRVAALYPELVRAAVVVEGLGPPDARRAGDPRVQLAAEARQLKETLSAREAQRPLPSVQFAAERLMANNPRLPPERASELARLGTEKHPDGTLTWAFDPSVSSVFLGQGAADSVRYWSAVCCPTCVVSGSLAGEYWGRAMPADAEWDGGFAEGELAGRVARFPEGEHVAIEDAGHMIHFDQPDRLAAISLEFLRRTL